MPKEKPSISRANILVLHDEEDGRTRLFLSMGGGKAKAIAGKVLDLVEEGCREITGNVHSLLETRDDPVRVVEFRK